MSLFEANLFGDHISFNYNSMERIRQIIAKKSGLPNDQETRTTQQVDHNIHQGIELGQQNNYGGGGGGGNEWANIILPIVCKAAIGLAVLSGQVRHPNRLHPIFHWLCLVLLLTFACFFANKLMASTFPMEARVLERVGLLFTVIAFAIVTIIVFLS